MLRTITQFFDPTEPYLSSIMGGLSERAAHYLTHLTMIRACARNLLETTALSGAATAGAKVVSRCFAALPKAGREDAPCQDDTSHAIGQTAHIKTSPKTSLT